MDILNNIRNKFLYKNPEWYEKYIDREARKLLKIAKFNGTTKVTDSINRVYIEQFIDENQQYIKGSVLEFKGTENYAHKYMKNVDKITYCAGSKFYEEYKKFKDIDFFFELDDMSTYPDEKFDCIIFTQCLPYVLTPIDILINVKNLLKPNGIILITSDMFAQNQPEAPFLSYITEKGLEQLSNITFGKDNIVSIKTYGDFNSALRYMLNIKRNNTPNYLNYHSPNHPVLITAVLRNS